MIGIILQTPMVHIKLGPVQAIQKSIQNNTENAVLIFQVIGRLLKREASVKQLEGPISIISISGRAYQEGFVTLLMFMALISINLGILNFLPVPILDGGLLVFFTLELFKRRPPSPRARQLATKVGLVIVVGLTVLALRNDVVRFLLGDR